MPLLIYWKIRLSEVYLHGISVLQIGWTKELGSSKRRLLGHVIVKFAINMVYFSVHVFLFRS